jgi:uncharacterized repeat protein (TIGR02543 family)
VVLPNLPACIADPSLAGCSVVLPSFSACLTTPNLPGCSVWSYTTDFKYDGNGNTGGTVPLTFLTTIGSSVTLATNTGTLVKTGYTFAGWNTLANGTGISYPENGSYVLTSSTIIYAQWTLNNYTVTFNANGGTGTMSDQTIAFNASANLTSNTFTRTGYIFAGWATTSGGAVAYANGASYTMGSADVTLFAKWTENNLNVTDFSNIKLNFYPNPVKEFLTISLGNNSTIMGYEIFDISGKRIEFKSNHDSNIIKVSRFSKGVYLLKVQTDTGMLKAKFIKE